VSRSDLIFYIVIGLIFEPLCLMEMTVHYEAHVRPTVARAYIEALDGALDLYKHDVGSFPPSLQALRTNPDIGGWDGPYLRQNVPEDPWGRPFLYRFRGQNRPEILSLGKDGKVAGRGDDQDLSSFHLRDPILPSAADYWRAATPCIALGCFVGYPFLVWVLRKPPDRRLRAGSPPHTRGTAEV
jgi:type II secretion system protein G